MNGFAARTGLTSPAPDRRYLWTDAFAVCNFLGLGETGLALRLVDRVHHTLGRHRAGEARTGWISGLAEAEGEAHPTRGGLRIGKPLPERGPGEAFDERKEWDRDGQYFHYLTRWMHALNRAARLTGQPRLNLWARELLHAAFASFAAGKRMAWKMSIDLSRALVPSMGQHDPLDGFITCVQLRADMEPGAGGPDLADALAGFAAMIEGRDWATADPLGLGGLLADALRAAQLAGRGSLPDASLVETLLAAALDGLRLQEELGEPSGPASGRLAFRELGLSIGLHAAEKLRARELPASTRALAGELRPYLPRAGAIESFWLRRRGGAGWEEHQDINDVMLATSLAPEGFLE
ncbi:MAG TPA: hypothetical protein VFL36_01220 [Myxococcales bacterium]|nr:hypothetical protein [Myxococcales bacterium]